MWCSAWRRGSIGSSMESRMPSCRPWARSVVSMGCSTAVGARELCHMLVLCRSCRLAPGRRGYSRSSRLATKDCERSLVTRLGSQMLRKHHILPDGKLQSSRHCLPSAYRRRGRSLETNQCCWKPLRVWMWVVCSRKDCWRDDCRRARGAVS